MRSLGVIVAATVAGAVIALIVGIAKASAHTVELAPILMLAGGLLALVRALFASNVDGPIPMVGGVALMITAFIARHESAIGGKALLLGFALFAIATAAGKTRSKITRVAGVIAAAAPLLVVADPTLYAVAGALYLLLPVSFTVDVLRSNSHAT